MHKLVAFSYSHTHKNFHLSRRICIGQAFVIIKFIKIHGIEIEILRSKSIVLRADIFMVQCLLQSTTKPDKNYKNYAKLT